jgi:hypothetical protein
MSELASSPLDEEKSKRWEDYAKKYNSLSKNLQTAGIDPKLLREVVDAAVNFCTYKKDFQDGVNLLKQTSAQRKPKYFILECESHRKDVHKLYGGRTGWLYKLVKTLREYVDEDEADRDLSMLRAGELTEDDVFRKRKRK